MSGFKRSPSKVWWGNESLEWREISASPGSQDSGFSDTETSPHLHANNNNADTPKKPSPAQRIPKDIFKELTSENEKQNLSTNYKEKTTPEKEKIPPERLVKSETKPAPQKAAEAAPSNMQPARKHRYTKYSPKVSRNLFSSKQKECGNVTDAHQYSRQQRGGTTHSSSLSTGGGDAPVDDSRSWRSSDTPDSYESRPATRSLPPVSAAKFAATANVSAPAVLEDSREEENGAAFNSSLSSDCESELECLFNGADSPKHTSTPKTGPGVKMCQRRDKLPLNLFLKCQQER